MAGNPHIECTGPPGVPLILAHTASGNTLLERVEERGLWPGFARGSRIKKSRILDIARETLGAAWVSTRSKYKKADLAKSMEEAFAAGTPPVDIGATMHAAALAWAIPGFAAFDTHDMLTPPTRRPRRACSHIGP